MNIINLDELVAEDRTVILKGKKYTIPGELPVDFIFELMKVHKNLEAKEGGDDDETLESQIDALRLVHRAFTVNHPNLKFEAFLKLITFKQFAHFSSVMMGSTPQEVIDQVNEQKKTQPRTRKQRGKKSM